MQDPISVHPIEIPGRLYYNLKNKGIYETIDAISSYIGDTFYPMLINGTDIIDQDWDILIIFDAARLDLLRDFGDFDAQVNGVQSPATSSWRYMQKQYIGRELHDTVLVSGNSYSNYLPNGIFHQIYTIIPDESQIGRIEPSLITNRALIANKKHPNKRIIVHYMQPHTPYLQFNDQDPNNPFTRARQTGDFDLLYSEYVENYKFAEKEAHRLIDQLEGKIAITADHGEALGERWLGIPMFGHGHWMPEVYEVPLLTVESDTRPEIFPEAPAARNHISDDLINKQLEALGYR